MKANNPTPYSPQTFRPRTPTTVFERQHALTLELLNKLAEQVATCKTQQAENPQSWSYPGTLDQINNKLAIALAELGDRSAVDELGIQF